MTSQSPLGHRIVPALLARDLEETLAFYESIGFRVVSRQPADKPVWAEITRDGITFQFHTDPPHGTPKEPTFSGTFYIFPQNVRTLSYEIEKKVPLAWGPEVMPYGLREFGIQDPNGYYLAFAEPADT